MQPIVHIAMTKFVNSNTLSYGTPPFDWIEKKLEKDSCTISCNEQHQFTSFLEVWNFYVKRGSRLFWDDTAIIQSSWWNYSEIFLSALLRKTDISREMTFFLYDWPAPHNSKSLMDYQVDGVFFYMENLFPAKWISHSQAFGIDLSNRMTGKNTDYLKNDAANSKID